MSAPWLAPSAAAWEARFGAGTANWGKLGKALQSLAKYHAPEKIAAHLDEYLHQTPAQYLNLNRFAETFLAWQPKEIVDADGVLLE